MSFEVGDVVECVDARVPLGGRTTLIHGHRYSVLEVTNRTECPVTGEIGIGLIINGPSVGMQNYGNGFFSRRFRKITGPCETARVSEMRKEPVTA